MIIKSRNRQTQTPNRTAVSPIITMATLSALLIAGCSSSSTDDDDDTIVTIEENLPVNMGISSPTEIDGIVVDEAVIDIFESRLNSCQNPQDSQFIGLSRDFSSKTLICLRYFIDASAATRDIAYSTYYRESGREFSNPAVSMASDGRQTIEVVTPLYLTEDRFNELPATLETELTILDSDGEEVSLATSSLLITGTLGSTDPDIPDGTEISINRLDLLSSEAEPSVLTRFRDLPDRDFCVDHDLIISDDGDTLELSHVSEGLLSQRNSGFYAGYHIAIANIPVESEESNYLVRVFETDDQGGCDVSSFSFAVEDTPRIRYTIDF